MKPRASTPRTLSTVRPAKWSAIASTVNRKASTSASRGVMSLNTTPGRGKSGMSRMWFFSQDDSGGTRSKVLAPGGIPSDGEVTSAALALLARPRRRAVDLPRRGRGSGAARRGRARTDPLTVTAIARGRGRAGHRRRGRGGEGRPAGDCAPRGLALADGGVTGLALLEEGEDGRRHEDRRVGAGEETDQQGEAEVLEGRRTEDEGPDHQHRENGHDRHQGGVD